MSQSIPFTRPCGPPPPRGVYETLDGHTNAINAHAASNGYKIVSNGVLSSGLARFRCAKGRAYASKANPEVHETKKRKTSTQMTGCAFKFNAKQQQDTSKWHLEIPDGIVHNHGWNDPTAFAQNRAQALEPHREKVIELANSGIRPAHILAAIQANIIKVFGKDVYNLIQKHRREELRGRSPLQTLYEDFLLPNDSEFEFEDMRDAQGHVTSLAIVHKH